MINLLFLLLVASQYLIMFFYLQTVLNTLHHATLYVRLFLLLLEKVIFCIMSHLTILCCWCLTHWWELWPTTELRRHSLMQRHSILFVKDFLTVQNIVPDLVNVLSAKFTKRSCGFRVEKLVLDVIFIFFRRTLFIFLGLLKCGFVKFARKVFGAHLDL